MMMFVFGYACMLWAFRSFGVKKGIISSLVGYPIWGFSFPYYSQWISLTLFGLMSRQIGLAILSSIIIFFAVVLYLLYHPLEEVIDAICEECNIDPLPGTSEET
jgi:hypothetical protein